MESNKYSKILELLKESVNQKIEPVINIKKDKPGYNKILWLEELPKQIFSVIADDKVANNEYWITISKPKEPKEPSFHQLSEVLLLWADKESLKDENGTPKLKQSIFVNGKTLLSTSYPQIEQELKNYIKDTWLDDLIEYKEQYKNYQTKIDENKILNKTYNELLEIYNKTESINDDLELVVCAGMLSYAPENELEINKHVLSCRAEINYDPIEKDSVIRLFPDVENVIQIETDTFAEINSLFTKDNLIKAEKKVYDYLKENGITNNIFDSRVKDALSLFAEELNNNCIFKRNVHYLETTASQENPTITFSPALVIRKKNPGGFTTLYENILMAIDEAGNEKSLAEQLEAAAVRESEFQEDNKAGTFNQAGNEAQSASQVPVHSTDNQIKINSRYDLLTLPEFLVFTSMNNVYKVQNKVFSNKLKIIENIMFEPSEKPIYITGTRNYSGFMIFAYENGKIGKVTMESYKTEFNRKKLKSAFNNESPLVFIEHIEQDIDLVAISSINKVILFNTNLINPVGSKTTKGFYVMKSKDGSTMAKIKKLEQVKFQEPNYYRREEGLNVVGFYLKQGDEI